MKAIIFRKFDEQGMFKGETVSDNKYTVRGAMEHLRGMGFAPMKGDGRKRKLEYCWTNGKGTNAYII